MYTRQSSGWSLTSHGISAGYKELMQKPVPGVRKKAAAAAQFVKPWNTWDRNISYFSARTMLKKYPQGRYAYIN